MSAQLAPAAPAAPLSRRAGFIARLARDRIAAGAAIVLLIAALGALFAPWIAPYDPYYTDMAKFRDHYPGWQQEHELGAIVEEMVAAVAAQR